MRGLASAYDNGDGGEGDEGAGPDPLLRRPIALRLG
jgi:hypothetical protein